MKIKYQKPSAADANESPKAPTGPCRGKNRAKNFAKIYLVPEVRFSVISRKILQGGNTRGRKLKNYQITSFSRVEIRGDGSHYVDYGPLTTLRPISVVCTVTV